MFLLGSVSIASLCSHSHSNPQFYLYKCTRLGVGVPSKWKHSPPIQCLKRTEKSFISVLCIKIKQTMTVHIWDLLRNQINLLKIETVSRSWKSLWEGVKSKLARTMQVSTWFLTQLFICGHPGCKFWFWLIRIHARDSFQAFAHHYPKWLSSLIGTSHPVLGQGHKSRPTVARCAVLAITPGKVFDGQGPNLVR